MSGIPSQTRFGCYIGNIDRSVTIDMLKQVFCQCGTIIDCSLNGREGDPYRFGFIDFATEDDRARALKYNGFTLVGRKLKVGISKGNVNKPEGFSTGNPGGVGSHSSDRARQGMAGGGSGAGSSGMMMMGGGGVGGNGSASFPRGAGGDMNAGMNAGGLTPQQQIEARLLLQLLQEGKMDARQLSPAQQMLLIASLNQSTGGVNNMNNMNGMNMNTPANPMMNAGGMPMMGGSPMPQQGMPMMPSSLNMGNHGGYGNPQMMGMSMQQPQPQPQQQPWGPSTTGAYAAMNAGQQTPPMPSPMYGASGAGVLSGSPAPQAQGALGAGLVNPLPSPDALRMREKQREQFFEVVRKDTEKYERKVQEKKAQAAAGGGGAERSDSSASDDDEKPAKKSKKDK